jgi:hypothetical protein
MVALELPRAVYEINNQILDHVYVINVTIRSTRLRQPHPDRQDRCSDRVVVGWMTSGTHVGTFTGIPPTVRIAGVDVYRFANDRMAEHWNVGDQLTCSNRYVVQLPPRDARRPRSRP